MTNRCINPIITQTNDCFAIFEIPLGDNNGGIIVITTDLQTSDDSTHQWLEFLHSYLSKKLSDGRSNPSTETDASPSLPSPHSDHGLRRRESLLQRRLSVVNDTSYVDNGTSYEIEIDNVQFCDTGLYIFVDFNTPASNPTPTGYLSPCNGDTWDSVFDDDTLNLLGSSDCGFTNVSTEVFLIELAPDASACIDDDLTFLSDAFFPLSGGIMGNNFTIMAIEAPVEPVVPGLILSYSNTLGECDDLIVDASASTGLTYKSTFTWVYNGQDYYTNTAELEIPTEDVIAGDVSVSVTVTNVLEESDSAEISMVKRELPDPGISMSAPALWISGQSLSLAASMTLPNCGGYESATYELVWTCDDSTIDLLIASVSTATLTISAGMLDVETDYTFTVTATPSSTDLETLTASHTVSIESTSLIAKIVGGDATQLISNELELDAEALSLDFDTASLSVETYTFHWECEVYLDEYDDDSLWNETDLLLNDTDTLYNSSYSVLNDSYALLNDTTGGSDRVCPGFTDNEWSLFIEANTLFDGITYLFTVTITDPNDDSRSGSDQVYILGVDLGSSVEIITYTAIHNANEQIRLTGLVTPDLTHSDASIDSYVWAETTQEISDALWTSNVDGDDYSTLTIAADTLLPGESYIFMLTVTTTDALQDPNTNENTAMLTIEMNDGPTISSFTISPDSGTALSTLFTISADADSYYWPNSYRFYYRNSDETADANIALTEETVAAYTETYLPEGNFIINVVVTDLAGATLTSDDLTVTVNSVITDPDATEDGICTTFQSIIDGLVDDASIISDVTSLTEVISLIVVTLEEYSVAETCEQSIVDTLFTAIETVTTSIDFCDGDITALRQSVVTLLQYNNILSDGSVTILKSLFPSLSAVDCWTTRDDSSSTPTTTDVDDIDDDADDEDNDWSSIQSTFLGILVADTIFDGEPLTTEQITTQQSLFDEIYNTASANSVTDFSGDLYTAMIAIYYLLQQIVSTQIPGDTPTVLAGDWYWAYGARLSPDTEVSLELASISDDSLLSIPGAVTEGGRATFADVGSEYDSVDLFVMRWNGALMEMLGGDLCPPLATSTICSQLTSDIIQIELDMDASTDDLGIHNITVTIPQRGSSIICKAGAYSNDEESGTAEPITTDIPTTTVDETEAYGSEGEYERQCSWFRMSADAMDEQWYTTGCEQITAETDMISCQCNHLTSFGSVDILADSEVEGIDLGLLGDTNVFYGLQGCYAICGIWAAIVLFRLFQQKAQRPEISVLVFWLCFAYSGFALMTLWCYWNAGGRYIWNVIGAGIHYVFICMLLNTWSRLHQPIQSSGSVYLKLLTLSSVLMLLYCVAMSGMYIMDNTDYDDWFALGNMAVYGLAAMAGCAWLCWRPVAYFTDPDSDDISSKIKGWSIRLFIVLTIVSLGLIGQCLLVVSVTTEYFDFMASFMYIHEWLFIYFVVDVVMLMFILLFYTLMLTKVNLGSGAGPYLARHASSSEIDVNYVEESADDKMQKNRYSGIGMRGGIGMAGGGVLARVTQAQRLGSQSDGNRGTMRPPPPNNPPPPRSPPPPNGPPPGGARNSMYVSQPQKRYSSNFASSGPAFGTHMRPQQPRGQPQRGYDHYAL